MADTTNPAAAHGDGVPERLLAWVKAHRKATIYVGGAIILAGAGIWFNAVQTRASEDRAWELLAQARVAFESGNLPLAGSEFSRIAENYGGTNAADQAGLLLAQVRLRQSQPQQAIEVLRRLTASASAEFRSQAWSLLGAAYENSANLRDAGDAYEQAAEHAQYPFMRSQALSDAGRVWVAVGDSAKAIAAYQRIVRDLSQEPGAQEATMRLAELTRGQADLPKPK